MRRPSILASLPDIAASLGAPSVDPALEPDPELNRLKAQVTEKRQELSRLEEARQRQLSELQGKLATLSTVYTPTHPSVVAIQQNLAAVQHESPQILGLKSELENLEAEYDERSSEAADLLIQATLSRRATAGPAQPQAPAAAREAVAPEPQRVEQPRTTDVPDFASLRLRTELNQLQSVLERTDGARIELAVSQAAFKYRYSVITPAQVPREPAFPNMRLVIIAGFMASLLLAIGVGAGTDLMSNRILEAWQLERQLGLPILGTARLA
jgi:uncharacterized protein involved in exopolysaccharide biosynthesis